MTVIDEQLRSRIAKLANSRCRYPKGRFAGAGIVTCAGGRTYYTCAWVLVNVLRHLGCTLPVEVWYRGRLEMNPPMKRLLESVPGVRCIDALEVMGTHPVRRLNGWETKPYAIINSSFEEVLFIDCDNIPTRDPSFLLHAPQYRRAGAAFWPDRWMEEGDPENYRTISDDAWAACGVERRNEPEFESGQMVINKRKSWKALQLTMFLNEHSDVFYELLLGDKDTFHMAWRRAGKAYAMPMHRPLRHSERSPVLYQHDFDGTRIFQHRNEDKWSYDGDNIRIADFEHEPFCFACLEELRRRWDGVVRRYPDDYTLAEQRVYAEVTSERLFSYGNADTESRFVELMPDFKIGVGRDEWETEWEVEESAQGVVNVVIRSRMRKMCVLTRSDGHNWAGSKLHFDRSPVVLEPVSRLPKAKRTLGEAIKHLLPRLSCQHKRCLDELIVTRAFLYHRVGYDARVVELMNDHTIGQGAADCERWWYVRDSGPHPQLVIGGDYGETCCLGKQPGGIWHGRWVRFEKMPIELVPQPTDEVDYGSIYSQQRPTHGFVDATLGRSGAAG